jgi:hypothetical protein
MRTPKELKADWEKRFPDLSGKWTHWRLVADGSELGLVPGEKLFDALKIVESNYSRFTSIKVCRATVNAPGACAESQKAWFEVSNSENDKRARGIHAPSKRDN